MAVPNAFLPLQLDAAERARYKAIDTQLRQQALDGRASDRARRLTARYARYPWLSPGIATAYTKWEEQYGTPAARGLASTVYNSASTGANRAGIQDDLEHFVATKDFQRQVKAFRDSQDDQGWFGDVVDHIPVAGAVKGIAEGKGLGEIVLRSIPGAKLINTAEKEAIGAAGELPGVGPTIKGASRVAFTALESPYQEVQAAGSSVLAHTVGAFQEAARSTVSRHAPVTNDISTVARPPQAPTPDSGLQVGNQSPFGTSTGAIALDRLLSGERVDLGTGYFPGGAVTREHTRQVRNIASFYYDHQRHFATPGRIVASTVTEPGSDPYNILSGSLDAIAMLKGDPVLAAGGKLEEIRAARKGFSVTPEALDDAGAVRTWWRATTHGPTVDQFLDTRDRGAALIDDLTHNYAGKPEQLTTLMRRTKWAWPADVYASIIDTPTGDRASIRSILGASLGASIPEQPRLGSFTANILNTTGQNRLFAEIPAVENDLNSLSGPNGTARAFYNHALGLGLSDDQISTHLHDIISASGKVERGEAVKQFLNMEGTALRNLGLPEKEVRELSAFARGDLDIAKTYYDGNIARGDHVPGVMIGGKLTPIEGPYLQAEYLGNKVWLPPLLGPDGRNRALARYGRILGIPGTGFTELEGTEGLTGLAESAYRGTRDRIAGSNTWLINAQNRLWKPVALLRGAWMLRVIGEEQVRMAMAGYDSLFHHPISYLAQVARHGGEGSGAEKNLLAWAADQGAMRSAQEGAFGLTDRTAQQYGRLVNRFSDTAAVDDLNHSQYWADTLIKYHEDEPMRALAYELSRGGDATGNAVERFTERFMVGDLSGSRADLATSTKLLNQGLDTATDAGAQAYIDGLYERLHYYTGGDPDLINMIATGKYSPDLSAIAQARGLNGRRVMVGDAAGEIVDHKKGAKSARVLFDDGTDQSVAISQLSLPDDAKPRVLTRTADNIRVDEAFRGHLDSLDPAIKPPEVSGVRDIYDTTSHKNYDRVVRGMFAVLMDKPTTYMSRSQVFLQEYLNEVQRLLPYADREAQSALLAQASDLLHQDSTIRGAILKGRFSDLEKAASRGSTEAGLTFEEADDIAKAHGLDTMRDLLYDSHKRNRTLASLQLLFPFGEAFKEMLGSWGRIIAEKPVTTSRKFQIFVNGARGANPFEYLPGGEPVKGKGFFYTDPSRGGAEMFAYPFTSSVNESLFGIPVEQVAPVQGLSMGLQLMPGVGPVVSFPAMQLMNRYMADPKWDPIREIVSPYGTSEPQSLQEAFTQQFAPSWLRKAITAWNGAKGGDTQSARVLNNLTMDIMAAGIRDHTYSANTPDDLDHARNDAYSKARWLYLFQSTFQFGAPSAPSFDFLTNTKNGKAIRFSIMRDAYYKLVDEDRANNTHDAAAKFINRFGETAMFVVGPKSLGSTFGEQYTDSQYAWTRRNPTIVDKYPLTYAEFAPRAKNDTTFSYDAYLRAISQGERTTFTPREWSRRVNNMLGTIWYDQLRTNLGLGPNDSGTKAEQMFLADKRTEIANAYPGFRQVASDDTRVPRAVNELVTAATDRTLARANPSLVQALRAYVAARTEAINEARSLGHSTDPTRPGFASSQDTAYIRAYLRDKAQSLATSSPQFYTLWEDVFSREMADD